MSQWLDDTAPVTAGHILKAAESPGRSVPDVTERLSLLGYTVPDAAAIEADMILASINLDGKAPWRTSTSRMSWLDLSSLARKMGISHDAAVARLRRLGYDALPRIDLVLVSEGLDGRSPWRAAGSAVPATTILRAADELDIGEHAVARRYRQLGYDVASTADDMALAALELMGGQPLWQIRQGRIWPEWVSWAARELGRTTDDVVRWLRSAGYVVLSTNPEPYLDKMIIGIPVHAERESRPPSSNEWPIFPEQEPVPFPEQAPVQGRFSRQDIPVSHGEILQIARSRGYTPARVAADLRRLGFPVPVVNYPAKADDELALIASRGLGAFAHGQWLHDNRPVPAGHVVATARRLVRDVDYVADRLRDAGYEVPDLTTMTQDDRILISVDLNGRDPWLRNYFPVGVWHLARTAVKLHKDPHQVASRLRGLGYEVPDPWG